MKTVFSFFVTILFATNAFPQASYELTCRAKAKELAAQSYSSCVTEARNTQVEQIRTNYQKELSALKSKYDHELKKMGGGSGSSKKANPQPVPVESEVRAAAPVPASGIAKQLPKKAMAQTEAAPVQTVSEGAKVIAVGSDKSAGSVEKEASDADQVEIIDMPTE